MSIMRVHKTSNFTVMSNYHFKEKKMSLKAKGLLSLMLSLPDDWDYSVSGLATLSKDGKDSIMSALGELEKFGYLSRVRLTNEKGQFTGIEYNIYEQPQMDSPMSENPISANQMAENPISVKAAQLNTNSIKDELNKDINGLNKNKAEMDGLLDSLVDNEELKELYQDYIEMRDNMQAPLTKRGLKMLIERCERLSKHNIKVQKLLLEAAIINNWKNVYLPNETELQAVNQETISDLRVMFGLE